MRINGEYEFKKAIRVDQKLLDNLKEILQPYIDKEEYVATLENGDVIRFENYQEMIQYDNYGKGKIEKLKIKYSSSLSINFETSMSLINNYKSTVTVEYVFRNQEDIILMREKLGCLFNKNKQPWFYTIITKISVMYFFIIIGSWSAFLNIININKKMELDNMNSIQYINLGFILTMIIILLACLLGRIRKRYIPSIVFYWGNEKERFDKNMQYVDKIFWGIIVALFLPVIIPLLLRAVF